MPLLPLRWTCAVAAFGSTSSELEVLQASAHGLFGPLRVSWRDRMRCAGAIIASEMYNENKQLRVPQKGNDNDSISECQI